MNTEKYLDSKKVAPHAQTYPVLSYALQIDNKNYFISTNNVVIKHDDEFNFIVAYGDVPIGNPFTRVAISFLDTYENGTYNTDDSGVTIGLVYEGDLYPDFRGTVSLSRRNNLFIIEASGKYEHAGKTIILENIYFAFDNY